MNYMFMRQCVETRPLAPIQQHWLDSIVARVPSRLKKSTEANKLLQELCMEVSDEFHSMMVKHTGIGSFLYRKNVNALILDFSTPWHGSFIRNRRIIKAHLHILHPVMQTMLDIGYTTFSPVVLVDFSGFRASGPVDCKSLQNKMAVECKRTEDRIMNTWFPKVIHLLTNKEILNRVKEQKMDSFYNCASTLISNQLKSLLQTNVEEFASVFNPSSHHCLPVFRMALTFDDEKMEIYPTLQDLESAVFEILNKVQTVQSWLAQTTSSFVDAKVDDHILAQARVTVKDAVRKNLEEPDKHFQSYVESYDWLANGTALARVKKFMEEEHSFDEYTEEFRALSKEIISLPSKARFTMVHLDCEELKQGLANKAKTYAEMLLNKLIISHREQNLQICNEFETIREKALKVPESTDEMAEMDGYINFMKTKGSAELTEKIKEAHCRLDYLLDAHVIDPEDLQLNSTVFLWPKNILDVFELNDEMIQKAKKKGVQELNAKREQLIEQLEKLGRRTEEFPYCSELDMMQQYVADVRSVQKFLQEAEDNIVLINKEEAFYKMDPTSYPQVLVIKESIEPYQKLFGFVLKWQRTENGWMNGSFQDLDGESMEVKVDEFFRESFKMLKFFQQKQNKAAQEMEKISGRTKRKPSEDDPEKQESPTITLCSNIMEQIKEFKVLYATII
uniref:Uncharacterized protein n=1 Tax=Acanthochromis polyacanthus TaxID=80966 RepID=A0A3Q1GHE1_9TELE